MLGLLVYDSLSPICRTAGNACVPRVHRPLPVSSDADSSGQHASTGHEPLSQSPWYVFVPVPAAGLSMTHEDGNSSELDTSQSQVEAHKSFLLQQIEVLFLDHTYVSGTEADGIGTPTLSL